MIGHTISHYRILEKLGEGGMGVVYKAEDTTLNRIVALKFLPPHSSRSKQDDERFLREAQTAAVLNHPNVCTVYSIETDHSTDEERQFIVMEYLEGMTLREKLAEGPLSVETASQYAIQIGEALHEAHSKNIVHRDVKADNVMVTPKNKIKVMDFGLAKLKGSLKLTRTSSTVGTLGYMAPEQIQGGEVDSRSDIFSFGVLFFEMLAGKMPFRGEHQAAMVYSIVNEPAEPIARSVPDASPELVNIFSKALEKNPEERYQTAIDMVVDIRRLKKQTSKITSVRSLMNDASAAQSSQPQSGFHETPPAATKAVWNSPRVLQIALVVVIALVAGMRFFARPTNASVRITAAQITDMPGEELHPDYSPDGNYVAFAKTEGDETNIYLQRIDGGSPINITKASRSRNINPAFSPKGDLIAFCSDRDGGGIYLMGATGESVRRLTQFGSNPAWSPDGKTIAFATEEVANPQGRSSVSQLWLVSVDNGAARLIDSGDVVQPGWSPDGNRIVFWGLPIGSGWRDLWSVDSEGKNKVRITNDAAIDWNPVWSPDGGRIFFLSDRSGTMNVWRIAIDEQSGKPLGEPEQVTVPASTCSWLTLSHDGKKVIYTSLEKRSNIFKIGFDPVAGQFIKPAVQITTGSKLYNWIDASPDGQRISTASSGVQEDIYVMNNDGTNIRRLTNDAPKDRGPHWSFDGKAIYSYSDRSGKYELWKINVDGSGLEQVTKSPVSMRLPLVFSDGRYIATSDHLVDLTQPIDQRVVEKLPPIPGVTNAFATSDVSADNHLLLGNQTNPGTHGIGGIFIYSLLDKKYVEVIDHGSWPTWVDGLNKIVFIEKGRMKLLVRKTNAVKDLDLQLKEGVGYLHGFSRDRRTFYFIKEEAESDIWQATIE